MTKNVLVVESPAKAKTINKYLGKDFTVLASYGHVRQLRKKTDAVDPNNHFAMDYEVSPDAKRHINAIISALRDADTLYLATDPDREGEAISWHLYEVLKQQGKLKDKATSRVVFNEITESAIKQAIKNARSISMDLVNAQQARSALDFLVGFNLSPLLWRKVQSGLSAGRVQSPALRLICQREAEIDAFVSQEFWQIKAGLQKSQHTFEAKLTTFQDVKLKQFDINSAEQASQTVAQIKAAADGKLTVADIEKKERKRNPSPPFITSTLQQEAANKLGFGATRTMRLAQKLYEEGKITYMRTDSVSLSNDAISQFRQHIQTTFGDDYLPDKPRRFKTKSKNAQEAHEAIRPTSASQSPQRLRSLLDNDLWRLYDLIWKRAIASQMTPAILDTVGVTFACGTTATFKASGSTIKHPGFLAVYQIGITKTENTPNNADADNTDNAETTGDSGTILPPLSVGETLQLTDIIPSQHFTEPPPRYSEATLVKALEEYDIGRPSTYASIIQTLLNREYVISDKRRLSPTATGKIVNLFLTKHFSRYVDYDFTAKLEDELDVVADGKKDWLTLLDEFWQTFSKNVEEKMAVPREEVMQARELGIDKKTGKPVSVRFGRYGPFVQLGTKEDEEKPQFASLIGDLAFDEITLEQALKLFELPLNLGDYEGHAVEVNEGRYGPYVKYDGQYISLGKSKNPFTVSYDEAVELIIAKQKADAPIAEYESKPVQKAVGRFGPYLKWNNLFINIPKKYDYDNLSHEDIVTLIEDKKRKEKEKLIHHWPEAGIRVEKARWGRFNIIKGKTKVELGKDFDVEKLTLEAATKLIEQKKPTKKTAKKATAKKPAAKKPAAKKPAAKKATTKKATTTKTTKTTTKSTSSK
ncbi:type I DNA topoisomerase [Ostreibacterium oceani]|uniref:DNA topoisomerase 1 n=1 Tax=Ostreibacterium oceani TaxID=2654998 RepID=A0A6N7EUL9_9GAMM|nr:type I DNA topoisomerase [Ostreibacterium oceani]MPV86152.1 type I DNA topoisomerase [Ostreibacterium oceani]